MKINLAFLRLIRFNFLALVGFIWLIYIFWTLGTYSWRGLSFEQWTFRWLIFPFVFISGILIVSSLGGSLSDPMGLRYLNSRALPRSRPLIFQLALASVFGGLFFLAAIPIKNHFEHRAEIKKWDSHDWDRGYFFRSPRKVFINNYTAQRLWEAGHDVQNYLYERWLKNPESRLKIQKRFTELKKLEKQGILSKSDMSIIKWYAEWLKEFPGYKNWKENNGPFPYEAFDQSGQALLRYSSIWINCITAFFLFFAGALLRLSWTFGAPGRVGSIVKFFLLPRNAVPVGFLCLILWMATDNPISFGVGQKPYPYLVDRTTIYLNFHWIVPFFSAVLGFISWALIRQWNLADITDEAV